MIHTENTMVRSCGTEAAISSCATSNHQFDTWDADLIPFEHCRIDVVTAVSTGTLGNQWTSMVILESSVTNISSATALASGTGTTNTTATTAEFTLPTYMDTSVKQIISFEVPLAKVERYLNLTVQASSITQATCHFIATLSRGSGRDTDAKQGAAQVAYPAVARSESGLT